MHNKMRLVRLLAVSILLLVVITGIGMAGWSFYQARQVSGQEEDLLGKLENSLLNIRGYHARLTTTLQYLKDSPVYQLEIWKSLDGCYRVEMITTENERQTGLWVLVFDGSRTYFYEPSIDDFYEVDELGLLDLPHLALENYWQSLLEAEQLTIVSMDEGSRHNYYMVEIKPGQPHRHRVRELVWLEEKSLLPVRIELFDEYDLPTQVTTFEFIQVNPELDPNFFIVEALTEPRGGSDFFGATTTAHREGDCYILNGQKRFVVGAEGADFFMVYSNRERLAGS